MPNPMSSPNFNPFEAPAPAQAPQGQQQQYPGNMAPVPTDAPQPHNPSQVPMQSQPPAAPVVPEKSLDDKMKEVWEHTPDPKAVDPDKLTTVTAEQAKQVAETSYKPNIDTEALTSALQNQDASAMADIITNVSREAYQSALTASSLIGEDYIKQERSRFAVRAQAESRKSSISNELTELNSNLGTAGPMRNFANEMVGKYLSKYPDAEPKAAAKEINSYIRTQMGLPAEVEQANPEPETKPTEQPTDWSNF